MKSQKKYCQNLSKNTKNNKITKKNMSLEYMNFSQKNVFILNDKADRKFT